MDCTCGAYHHEKDIGMDVYSKSMRSKIMSRIKGRGNEKTEGRLARLMRAESIKGWRRHLPILGRPDFAFQNQKLAIFVDGCFWHGCPKCFQLPKQNRVFWKAKIEGNRKRDRSVNGRLRSLGWKVVRIKECSLDQKNNVLEKIKKRL